MAIGLKDATGTAVLVSELSGQSEMCEQSEPSRCWRRENPKWMIISWYAYQSDCETVRAWRRDPDPGLRLVGAVIVSRMEVRRTDGNKKRYCRILSSHCNRYFKGSLKPRFLVWGWWKRNEKPGAKMMM